MRTRPPLLLLGGLALLAACGHRADPLPPLRRTPPALAGFRLAQRGELIELQAEAPAASVDGVSYEEASVEFLHTTGRADLDKTGRRQLVRVPPGGRASTIAALPAPGTLVRAAARGFDRGERGPRTLIQALVAQPPLEPPRELAAVLGEAGIELSWKGTRPKEVPPPVGPRLPGQPPIVPAGAPAAAGAPPGGTPVPQTTAPPPATGAAKPEMTASGAASGAPEATPPAGTVQPPPPRRSGFFVYRRSPGGRYDAPLGEPLERRDLRDESAPLAATWCYVVRAVASTEPLIESEASNEVCLARRDITPPLAPAGLALLPRPGGLELLWTPSGEEDLAGYRVYRAAGEAAAQRLVELAPNKAGYLDETAQRGLVYRYTLSAIDRSGNESPPCEPQEATLP